MKENGVLTTSYGSKKPIPLRQGCVPALIVQTGRNRPWPAFFLRDKSLSSSLSKTERSCCLFCSFIYLPSYETLSMSLCLLGSRDYGSNWPRRTQSCPHGTYTPAGSHWVTFDDCNTSNLVTEPCQHALGLENHLFN